MLFGLGDNSLLLFLLALWTLPWKGIALWRAAKRGENKWFIAILVLNTLALLEIFYIFVMSKKSQKEQSHGKLNKARMAVQNKKGEAKKKILKLFSQKSKISNDDVEKLLGVSHATATRYLEELEKSEEITQKGKVGRGVFYGKK